MAGKGSSPRSLSVTKSVYDLRYELAFGTAEQKKKAKEELIKRGLKV